ARIVEFADTLVASDVAHAVGQRLAIGIYWSERKRLIRTLVRHAEMLALDRHTIDVQHAIDHLDAVARQTDHALDEIAIWLWHRAEHDHFAALRFTTEQAAVRQQALKRRK